MAVFLVKFRLIVPDKITFESYWHFPLSSARHFKPLSGRVVTTKVHLPLRWVMPGIGFPNNPIGLESRLGHQKNSGSPFWVVFFLGFGFFFSLSMSRTLFANFSC